MEESVSTNTILQVINKTFNLYVTNDLYSRKFDETKNITEQHILSRALKMLKKINKKEKDSENVTLWTSSDKLFPPPEKLSWVYFPMNKVVSGKWYKNEEFR